MMEDGVGDDLFVGGVLFGIIAGEEVVVFFFEEGGEILIGIRIETLEGADIVEEGARDDEDFFVGVFLGHEGGFRRREAGEQGKWSGGEGGEAPVS